MVTREDHPSCPSSSHSYNLYLPDDGQPAAEDYYLVQWAPPHAMDSYADTPQGCEQFPHATWEPDECLPDELDASWRSSGSLQGASGRVFFFFLRGPVNPPPPPPK